MSRTSYIQFVIMVEFMERNGDLSKPSGGPCGRHWCLNKWRELAERLNSEGMGVSRSVEKWRKVWSDLKNNTKRKWAAINRAAQRTGGGPPFKMSLSNIESRVMAIMGIQAAVGSNVAEIGFIQVQDSLQPENIPPIVQIQGTTHDEEWLSPHPVLPSSTPMASPPRLTSPPHLTSPPRPTSPSRPTSPPSPTSPFIPPSPLPSTSGTQRQVLKKKRGLKSADRLFLECEMNTRKDNRERDRVMESIERERIRQRDVELRQRDVELRQRETQLQLQAEFLEFLKEAMNVVVNYLNQSK